MNKKCIEKRIINEVTEGVPYFFRSFVNISDITIEKMDTENKVECVKKLVNEIIDKNNSNININPYIAEVLQNYAIEKILKDAYGIEYISDNSVEYNKIKNIIKILESACFGRNYSDIVRLYLAGRINEFYLEMNKYGFENDYIDDLITDIFKYQGLLATKQYEEIKYFEESLINRINEIFVAMLSHIQKEYRASKVWIVSAVSQYYNQLGIINIYKNSDLKSLAYKYAMINSTVIK